MTRKRRALVPSRTDTVQAIKSELSLNKKKKKEKTLNTRIFFTSRRDQLPATETIYKTVKYGVTYLGPGHQKL